MAQRLMTDTEPRVQQLSHGLYRETCVGPQGLASAGLSVSVKPTLAEYKSAIFVMTKNQGKKITLFLVDGEPDGIKRVTLGGWNGIGFIFPRNKLKEFSLEEVAQKPGVYFLFGKESEENQIITAYIGHTKNLLERINFHSHDPKKDFWHMTIVFVGTEVLGPHANYLESRCVELANAANHFGYTLTNGNEPRQESLIQDDDRPAMEGFLENIKLILTTLGYPILQKIESKTTDDKENPLFFCQNADGKTKGTARMTNEGFIVYKGSAATTRYSEALAERNKKLIDKLVAEGVLKQDGDLYVFERDYNFVKPSAPAELIVGYPVNGWDLWKTAGRKTLNQIYRQPK